MQILADLHIHSKYSRATSPSMDLTGIAVWASKKGIDLISTGDWTHPLWFREIKLQLKEVSSGIYILKNPPKEMKREVRFILTTEISSIYSQGGKTRRVHNLFFSPSLSTCDKFIKTLQKRGAKLMSDGRPIVGLSSKELLEIMLGVDNNMMLVPCHIWTPWFSLYGSKSGFDSIKECFEELKDNIYAIETGLSSDPVMNWGIKDLDNRSILSSSDAHSGPKLGREGIVFVPNTMSKVKCPNSAKASLGKQMSNVLYNDIIGAIKQDPKAKLKIAYTIEFFPEEGKYHWSGHRKCKVCYSPEEVKQKGSTCPVCTKPLTIGVENRVLDLTHKNYNKDNALLIKNKNDVTFVYDKEKKRAPYVSLIPLEEILIETEKSPTKAKREYNRLIDVLGTEFDILLSKTYDEIEKVGGKTLASAMRIVRNRLPFVEPGFDGEFGKVEVFSKDINPRKKIAQETLF